MKVIVGSARMNEFENLTGGEDGDQTGKECSTQEFYVHELGWTLLRAKESDVALKIGECMQMICDNDNIGYDYNRKNSLYNACKDLNFDPSKVEKKCNTNCAGAVRICILYAGIKVANFYTGTEAKVIMETGMFDMYTGEEVNDPAFLKVGDILVTKKTGHTVVVVSVEETGDEIAPVTPKNKFEVYCDTKFVGEMTVKSGINIRLFGGTDMEILGTVKKGEKVMCDGIYAYEVSQDKKWFHLNYKGLTGFGSEVLLSRE